MVLSTCTNFDGLRVIIRVSSLLGPGHYHGIKVATTVVYCKLSRKYCRLLMYIVNIDIDPVTIYGSVKGLVVSLIESTSTPFVGGGC